MRTPEEILADIIRQTSTEAFERGRLAGREEAAKVVESFAPDYPTKTLAAAIRRARKDKP